MGLLCVDSQQKGLAVLQATAGRCSEAGHLALACTCYSYVGHTLWSCCTDASACASDTSALPGSLACDSSSGHLPAHLTSGSCPCLLLLLLYTLCKSIHLRCAGACCSLWQHLCGRA